MDPEAVVTLFEQLCRINSPSREEREIANFVTNFLNGLGLEVQEDEAYLAEHINSTTGNLVATLRATHGCEHLPRIFFSTHLDTVVPNPNLIIVRDRDANGREIICTDGGSILGADSKAGLCAILQAIRQVVEENRPHGQIQLLLTVCEEIGLHGARYLNYNLVESDFGFVFDSGPPVGDIIIQSPSHRTMTVTIEGRAAHAAVEPHRGVDAIQIAAHAICLMRLGRIDDDTTANIGSIHGGEPEATNVVCPQVVITAEARSLDNRKLSRQISHMRQCFRQSAYKFGGRVTIDVFDECEGYELDENGPPVRVVREAGRQIGLEATMKRSVGTSDANIFNRNGLPCCLVGTAQQNVHSNQEFVYVEDLVNTALLALEIINVVVQEGHGANP